MAERTVIEYKAGDLVRWCERYADGFMTKDTGHGIVLKKRTFKLGFKAGPYVNYQVFRTKHNDKMIFEAIELQRIENEE
jgi:hypothetical protein